MSPGDPLLLLEYRKEEIAELPYAVRTINPSQIGGANLAFTWLGYKGRSYACWFLCKDGIGTLLSRRIRLGLMRLHAEHQVLKHILASVLDGTITYTPKSVESDRLDTYLLWSVQILSRERRGGINLGAIQEVVAADEIILKEDLELLRRRLDEVRRQIRIRVQAYAEARGSQPRIVVQMDNNTGIVTIGEHVVQDTGANQTNNLTISGGTFNRDYLTLHILVRTVVFAIPPGSA